MTTLYEKYSSLLPETSGALVVLSGGMDSTIAARLCVQKYGSKNVSAITFFYGQKQQYEIECASKTVELLGLSNHFKVNIGFLGEVSKSVSANVVGGLEMPTIQDILGDPTPPTYVPNRNAILLMCAAACAESSRISAVVTGLQAQDQYGYHDTTPRFVASLNNVLNQSRTRMVQIYAPFIESNKYEEIKLLQEMDQNVDLLKTTITCYNPVDGYSCGRCPSCAERIANFMKAGLIDPIPYSIGIQWRKDESNSPAV